MNINNDEQCLNTVGDVTLRLYFINYNEFTKHQVISSITTLLGYFQLFICHREVDVEVTANRKKCAKKTSFKKKIHDAHINQIKSTVLSI